MPVKALGGGKCETRSVSKPACGSAQAMVAKAFFFQWYTFFFQWYRRKVRGVWQWCTILGSGVTWQSLGFWVYRAAVIGSTEFHPRYSCIFVVMMCSTSTIPTQSYEHCSLGWRILAGEARVTWVAVLLSLLLLPLLLLLLPLLLLLLKGWYEVEYLPSAVYSATVLHIVCNDDVFCPLRNRTESVALK